MDLHRRDRDIPGRLRPLPGLASYGCQVSGAQTFIAVAGLYSLMYLDRGELSGLV